MLKASITLNQMDSYKEIVPRPVLTSTTHAQYFFQLLHMSHAWHQEKER